MGEQQTTEMHLDRLEEAIRDMVGALKSLASPDEPNLSGATYEMLARPTPCPKCGSDEHIEDSGTSGTLMGFDPYWSRGKLHAHDPNRVTRDFKCRCGHRWTQTSYPPCPACGWTANGGGERNSSLHRSKHE